MATSISLMLLGLAAAIVLLLGCIYFFKDWCNPSDRAQRNDPEVGLVAQPVGNSSHRDGGSAMVDRSRTVQETTAAASNRVQSFQTITFTYHELEAATEGFSKLLGEGGFGQVFLGVLPDGRQVAVKKLKIGSRQGDRELRVEIETIGRIHHRNLVSLIGYCIDKDNRLLVYEFIRNNSLKSHLHGKMNSTMKWPDRMKIAKGAAKGLNFLHEDCKPRIIHRDIKADNILLGDDFEPKVGLKYACRFGLAKLFSDNVTHISTSIKGTFGYLAPEYASTRKLTEKSDMYSFGVMLLKLITEKQPVNSNCYVYANIVGWAKPRLIQALENRNYGDLVDPRLGNDFDYTEMTRMIFCAAACTSDTAMHRPRISQVVGVLEGNISTKALFLDCYSRDTETLHCTVSMGSSASDYT